MKLMKKSIAVLLAVLLAFPAVTATAVDLNIQWPAVWNEGTPPDWALTPTNEVKAATLQAINKEYNDQLANGYRLGTLYGFSAWGNMVTAQFQNADPNNGDTDNTGNPWGHANRFWGAIVAPYPGIAFSLRANFAKTFTNISAPISNEFTFTHPIDGTTKTYQMYKGYYAAFTNPAVESTKTTSTNTVGKGAMPLMAEAMQEAYAISSYNGYCPGIPADSAVGAYGDFVYQKFYGPHGTSYIAAKNGDKKAYVIIGGIYEAFAKLSNSEPYKALDVTGAPIGTMIVDDNGNLRQDFENMTIIVGENGDASYVSRENYILTFEVENGEVFMSGDRIEVIVPEGTDLTSIAPVFTISEKATCDRVSGEALDFTNPVEFRVTAENGDVNVYIVEIYTDAEPIEQELSLAQTVIDMINMISDTVSRSDEQAIWEARQKYEGLPARIKRLVTNFDKLVAAENALASLTRERIRVACVGDSITEGVGATSAAFNYPSYLQEKLGYDYDVRNFGHSGTTLTKNGDNSYWNSSRFTASREFNPDIVIIMLGTNDSKPRNWNDRNCKNTYEADLTELVNIYKNLSSKPIVYIMTSPTVYQDTVDTINEYTVANGVVPLQRKVAEATDSQLIDIYGLTAALSNKAPYFADGCHPSSLGYDLMSGLIAQTIRNDYNNAELDKIVVDGREIEISSKTINMDYVSQLPEIESAIAKSRFANVEITQADEETKQATIRVTSKCGMYIKQYTINFAQLTEPTGDVDGDGRVTVTDIVAVRAFIMEKMTPTEVQLFNGDLDKSGTLTVTDIIAIRRIIMS